MCDFNQHTQTYREKVRNSISFAKADSDYILKVKADLILDFLKRYLSEPSKLKVLDVGCGIGLMDQLLSMHVKTLYGVDIASNAIEHAKNVNPNVHYQVCEKDKLPFPNNHFDASFAVCVLHHVDPASAENFMHEMWRVTKPKGLVIIFEHNPLNPLTQMVVSRCELDKNATLLSHIKVAQLSHRTGLNVLEKRSILYFPWKGKFLKKIDRALGCVPFGGQYYVVSSK